MVSGLAHLNFYYSYQWTNNSDNSTLTTNSTILFPSLTLFDAGEYTCKINASSSSFVSGYVIATKRYGLYVRSKQLNWFPLINSLCLSYTLVPEPSSVMIMSSPQKIYNGSNFTLDCIITLNMSIIAVLQSLKVSVNLTGPANYKTMMPEIQISEENSLQKTVSDTINLADSLRTGTYTCAAKVVAINSSYLVTSSIKLVSTDITISTIILHYIFQVLLLIFTFSSNSFSSKCHLNIIKLNFSANLLDEREHYR